MQSLSQLAAQPERDSAYTPIFQVMFVLQEPHRLHEAASLIVKEGGGKMDLGINCFLELAAHFWVCG